MSKFINHYSILGIDEKASAIEIAIAYKTQCFKWHPDRNHGVEANSRIQEINEAKRILSNSDLRESYNREYQAFKKKTTNQSNAKDENKRRENINSNAKHFLTSKTDSEL